MQQMARKPFMAGTMGHAGPPRQEPLKKAAFRNQMLRPARMVNHC
jgi:hypothetical protein